MQKLATVVVLAAVAGIAGLAPPAPGRQAGPRGRGTPPRVPAHWILVSAQRDGSCTVTNPRNGFSKTDAATPSR